MYILNVKDKIKLLKDKNDDEYLIKTHRMSADFYMKNKDIKPSEEVLRDAINSIEEHLNIILTIKQLKELLVLYPFVKIDLAYHEEVDSEIREKLDEMICNYLIGTNLPTYGDELTPEEHKMFFKHLHEEALRIGYKVSKGE